MTSERYTREWEAMSAYQALPYEDLSSQGEPCESCGTSVEVWDIADERGALKYRAWFELKPTRPEKPEKTIGGVDFLNYWIHTPDRCRSLRGVHEHTHISFLRGSDG